MSFKIILASILFIASTWFLIYIWKFYKTKQRQYLLSNNICPYCIQPFQKCVVWDNTKNSWDTALMCPELHCGFIYEMPLGRTTYLNDVGITQVSNYNITKLKYKFLDGFGKPMKIKEIMWT